MYIPSRAQSFVSAAAEPSCNASARGAECDRAHALAAAHRHGYPQRQPGTGYGHSSGYAGRENYKGLNRYVESAAPALFRFH